MNKQHPVQQWHQASQSPITDLQTRLRLAAMAGHMQQDQVAARRAALIDLLSDGKIHSREAIWALINEQLAAEVWGKRPAETLQRDMHILRQGGIRIAYSRRKGYEGYYLEYPALERPRSGHQEPINWLYVDGLKALTSAEKNERAFGAAEFALKQKSLLLKQQHPDWTEEAVLEKARKIVYGVSHE